MQKVMNKLWIQKLAVLGSWHDTNASNYIFLLLLRDEKWLMFELPLKTKGKLTLTSKYGKAM